MFVLTHLSNYLVHYIRNLSQFLCLESQGLFQIINLGLNDFHSLDVLLLDFVR